jgi:hypothetical protein
MNDELWTTGKEVVVIYFKLLYNYSSGIDKEEYEACQYSRLASWIKATDHYIVLVCSVEGFVTVFALQLFCWSTLKAAQRYLRTELYISSVISSYVLYLIYLVVSKLAFMNDLWS